MDLDLWDCLGRENRSRFVGLFRKGKQIWIFRIVLEGKTDLGFLGLFWKGKPHLITEPNKTAIYLGSF